MRFAIFVTTLLIAPLSYGKNLYEITLKKEVPVYESFSLESEVIHDFSPGDSFQAIHSEKKYFLKIYWSEENINGYLYTKDLKGSRIKKKKLKTESSQEDSTIYKDGVATPVTVLRYEPLIISQVKTEETDGYQAVQIAGSPKRAVRTGKAEKGHLKGAGFENGAYIVKEARQSVPEGATVGQKILISSLSEGDLVKITARSKGRGFAGTMKRFDFGGGPASHGSGFHRRPGSAGNRTWPGRVIPGKRMPGHYGNKNITVRNLKVVEVNADENVLFIKGAVPGARNTLVQLTKEAVK